MVRLERIVIQGFKSFKRKTSIPFPTGFSVITGPNGSGKSNCGDAISFVLGRTSSRTLRAKKAQDLIFHGSKNKAGADYASVVLYFDNRSGAIPIKDQTVSVGRRLNKKGISTYRLNGKVVTRQQVLDVFSQAGMHPNGHNIIQQGDVNQIVEMDAVERREILDEISGISEYDEKKEKAEKELEKIAEKVREAEILLNEKTQVIERLRAERDAALRYKTLETELAQIRAALIWKDYSQSEMGMKELSEKLAEKEKLLVALENYIRGYDDELSQTEKKLEALMKDVVKASEQIEVSRRLAKLQAEIERIGDKIESNRRETERLDSMVERLRGLDRGISPAIKPVLEMKGVMGTVSNIIRVPGQYATAFEVAAGSHASDIVVDTANTAVHCVNYLKANRAGRARFLPLDKLQSRPKGRLPAGAIGWMSDLVKADARYSIVVSYILGSTACVGNIETANRIFSTNRVRMVTLDGDLVETSGAITGGFYKKRVSNTAEISKYVSEKGGLENETEKLRESLREMNKEMESLAEREKTTKTSGLEKERVKLDETLKKIREKRAEAYEKRITTQQEVGRLSVNKAKIEARFDDLKVRWEQQVLDKGKKKEEMKDNPFSKYEVPTLKTKERDTIVAVQELGPVNLKALQDFDELKDEFDDFKAKVDKIVEEKESIENTIRSIEEKRLGTFMHTFKAISRNFKETYRELTQGDADIELERVDDINSGLMIKASPSGKKLLHIDSMSGGEKTLTAFAFLFAIQRHKPTPFYILDEADATLDAKNTKRVVDLIKKQSKLAQFIVISHNNELVKEADQVYGVTMDAGESKVMGIRLPEDN